MTDTGAIKGVLFDVHDTLVIKDYRASAQGFLGSVAVVQAAGYEITAEDYHAAWKRASQLARQDARELGEVTLEGWYGAILNGMGITDYSPRLVEQMNGAFNSAFATATKALPQTKSTLRRLKRSYLLGIVSNSLAPNTVSDLTVSGIHDLFDAIVISSDFGKRKPHPAIFLNALERLGINPGEAVFVGDNPYEDIFGAKEVGMGAVLITHPMVERARAHRSIPPLQHAEVYVQADACISGLGELTGVLDGWNLRWR